MAFQKNINGFYENPKDGEYKARFSVKGEVSVTIKASSLSEAQDKASAMVDDDDFGMELDSVDDVSIDHVFKTKPMFLVSRGGKAMQVSHIASNDIPREPDERGF